MAKKKAALTIIREFDAPKDAVFKAFTSAEAMAEWWGPAEFPITVMKFDCRPEGIFQYKMQLPDQAVWAKFVYGKIEEPDLLEFVNSFCTEKGEITRAWFSSSWPLEIFNRLTFTEKNGRTTLTLTGHPINPTAEETDFFIGMQSNVQQGFNGTFNQLEQYLNAQFKLRKEQKKTTMPRTTTYLNFPGNTEEAFTFYKSVFGGEFHGKGIQRFGDIPPTEGVPPVADDIKKMVLHVELPLLGGHVLMGTDAPEEMGFKINFGNNCHICLEPDSREETKRLFEALSEGGKIIDPLKDMFFGAYYGSCTDKFGVSWMVNYTTM